MDEAKYDRQVELVDLGEAEALAVKMVMQEGALRFQDACTKFFTEKNMPEVVEAIKAVPFDL